MEEKKRLEKVLAFIKERGWTYKECEEDGCGSIDFEYRGVSYHIWEFYDKIGRASCRERVSASV